MLWCCASLHAGSALAISCSTICQKAYPVDVGSKLAGEDEAVNALLQTWDVHDLHKIAFDSAQLLRIAYTLVLWMLTLQHTDVLGRWHIDHV